MPTKLMDGKSPIPDDNKILAIVAKHTTEDGHGLPMCVGVRNEAGDIYRAIRTFGPTEFMKVCTALQGLGFTDELLNSSGMAEGCDAIFRRTGNS